MRITLQIIAVFESARFALIDIDRHQSRCILLFEDAPLTPSWKPSAAKASKPGRLELFNDYLAKLIIVVTTTRQSIASSGTIGIKTNPVIGCPRPCQVCIEAFGDALRSSVSDCALTDHGNRRLIATPNTRHCLDPNAVSQPLLQCAQQLGGAKHLTGYRVTHSDRQWGWRGFTFTNHIKVMVKSGYFIHFSRREP